MVRRVDERGGSGGEGAPVVTSAVFDGPSLYARAWYAARNSEELSDLPSADGGACAALKIVCSLLGQRGRLPWEPDRLLFCWDGEKRKTEKPRTPKPTEYDEDQAYFRELLGYLLRGVAQVVAPGEADDAVATAAFREAREGRRVVVVSGDKDLHQLRRGSIHYYCLNRRDTLTSEVICDLWHVGHPAEVAVALAVIGDPGDGIHGVPGWGPKKFAAIRDKLPARLPLADLVEGVVQALPIDLQDAFLESLDVTMLRPDVPGIPCPAEYRVASMAAFDRVEGLRRVRSDWAHLVGREQAGS